MNLLVTLPDTDLRATLVPPRLERRLEALGTVTWNTSDSQFTAGLLRDRLRDTQVCVTGWGTPRLTASPLREAANLELVVHIGATVAPIASESLFDRGVPICSARTVMAPFVAEGILGMALSTLREIPRHDAALKRGEWSREREHDGEREHGSEREESLFGATIGFVGLGAVGEALLELLEPFDVTVLVYDPYVDESRLAEFPFASRTDLDSVLENAQVVSVHAAKTPETLGLLDADRLATIGDGALLVNAARGAIVDTDALAAEVRTGRLAAALDVFEREPLPADSDLRALDNVVLTPHVAGAPARHRLAEAMVAEAERFARGDPLEHRITRERYRTMTQESLTAPDRSGS